MADMGEGFDKLVAKLQQAANLSDKIDKHWANIAKNAASAGGGAGGGAGSGVGGGGDSMKGGHGNLGGGKNVMASSFGSSVSQSETSKGKFATSVKSFKDITTPTMANGKDAFGGSAKAIGRMMGVGQPSAFDINGGPGQILAMQEQKRKNEAQMEKARGLSLGMNGVNKSRFDAMTPASQANITSSMYGLGDTVSLMSGLSSAGNTMMPEVQATMDRVTGYYNAGVRGGTTRKNVEDATFNTLSKGMTSVGSDAQVAQYLTGRGMSVSGDAGSTYQQTVNSVANAGRYMNISNQEAAASVEGLTSAGGAANMLKNFGIYTADLKTGKEKSQGQIFEELANRLTAGRGKATQEQTQSSIRRGSLGVTIDSFFQGDTQGASMFKQYMMDRTKGGNASSWDTGTNTSLSGDKNPLASQMAMNASDTGAMASAQNQYIAGISQATKLLQALNGVVGGLASTIAGANTAMTQTLFGANSVKGITGGLTTSVNFAGKAAAGIGQAFMGMDALNPAPALAEMGIIAGSAGLSLATAASTGLLSSVAAGFGGGSPNGGGLGGPSDSFNSGASVQLFSLSNLTSHGINRGPTGGHKGYDYAYHYGDPVYSIGDGTVVKADRSHNYQDKATSLDTVSGSLGMYVVISHIAADGTQYTSLYGHLSQISVSPNDKVYKGQIIGKAGNTGGTWPLEQNGDGGGSHLHFELSKGKSTPAMGAAGISLDPTQYANVLENQTGMQLYNSLGNSGAGLSSVTGGTGTTGSMDMSNTPANTTAQGYLSGIEGKVSGAMSILGNLYSNDPTKMSSAISAMAMSYGMSASQLDYYKNGGTQYLPASGAPGGGALTPPSTGNTGQSVNITVQVPDVTAADAVKFAQLVKQYLDDSSLLSNMGSN